MDIRDLIWVGVGGFFGAPARYIVSLQVPRIFGTNSHWGTLTANFTGSLLLAFFIVWVGKQASFPPKIQLIIATGFFGSYTTFSSFANETVALYRLNGWNNALVYLLLTNLLCLLGVGIGIWIGQRI